ncbi:MULTISPECIES: MarR family winged helix-turn-helix transcriptional regulator [unclassified Sphingomonas]|uniref:MarR family winged helix-turn-helix transcriptional regulator n=1 Tax=unclassified Sphingomonas TaxID=196159 RepID=UPI0022B59103|nr:MarR family transcriptional regulator [Sphingomonas sp. NIBR02145]WHU04927.1 MarR family transcriptional regulator [Sphingomonas sp. NIBR02145]
MTRANLRRDVARTMPQVSRGWRQLADAALAELRVSNSMGWCLIHLHRLGPEARQTDLAQEIGITGPSTVSVLNQLEQAALVERVPNPDDKRSNRLVLTEAGAALVDKIEARFAQLRRELFDGVPEEEIATMLHLLELLNARIAERRG